MSETTQWMLMFGGLGVIGLLLVVIRGQLRDASARRRAHEERLAELEAEAQRQRDYLEESVRVIASAVRDGQCEVVEGCIRLKKLLDHLAPWLHEHPQFSVFNQVFEAAKHIPMLDAWKALKLRQRAAYLKEMEQIEKDHGARVHEAAAALVGYEFRQ